MPFWNKEIETISLSALENLQLTSLRRTMVQAAKAPFYNRLFSERKIGPDSIQGLADLRLLPLTSKDDLRAVPPTDFLAVPQEKVVRLHASSGTTGTPTAVFHTQNDLDAWTELTARCLCMVGLTPADVFQNMVGYGLFTGGLGMHYGAERLGATVIPSGVGASRRQINLMKQFHTTAMHIIPSYALKLLETLAELSLDPRESLELRLAVVGAEPHSEGARQRIEEAYGISAYNCYGLSEMNGPGVAFECPEKTGLHLWEDSFLVEILDPVTLEPAPPGQVGEVVLTTLRREAMPLLRYRTKDLARLLPGPCPCGRPHRRLSRLKGRTDDMLILKGVNIFPIQVEKVLAPLPETNANYLIILEKEGPVDAMTVCVEMSEAFSRETPEALQKTAARIADLLRDEILISPKVELAAPGALPSSEGKAVRVLDKRPREEEN
ncbi:MAG: phenylacetate--CoA ligase [Pseudomonadota bacterium]